ncbi:MAG: hypothetical protein SCALA702_00860 [Melioribacteraceae bacterium]|nr:MAG: hypothetical protein SCALA702_00860 [Melioribacteraceae bacterium]
MKKRANCFISYNHKDVDKISLDYLVSWMKSISRNKIEFLFDTDLKVGDDLTRFINLLEDVNAVLLILTPGYKNKVLNRERWVYNEYKIIMDRYWSQKEENAVSRSQKINFDLIPILLGGKKETSVPNEIDGLVFADLLEFLAFEKNNDIYIHDKTEKKYKKIVSEIISKVLVNAGIKSPEFIDYEEELFDKLFIRTKEDWHKIMTPELFVETNAFKNIEQQSAYFLIGRKGSGKSTVTNFLSTHKKKNYKGVFSISADSIDLESVFGFYNSNNIFSDTKYVFARIESLKFVWELFFYLCSIELIVNEYEDNKLTDYQISNIPPLKSLLGKIKKNGHSDLRDNQKKLTEIFFIVSLDSVIEFQNYCINSSGDDPKYFRANIKSKYSFQSLLEFAIGTESKIALLNILNVCKRRILITLDGFDNSFERYRQNTLKYNNDEETKNARVRLEIEWLNSMLNLILDIKNNRTNNSRLNHLLDFCITVPKDRFYEIRKVERDSYLYIRRYFEINWSANELLQLLTKRLSVLANYELNRKIDPNIFHLLLNEKFPTLPNKIAVPFNDSYIDEDIFIYILRFTFWRPRGILMHFASIIAMARHYKNNDIALTDIAIRNIIDKTSIKVIESEFINEFQNVLINIRDILNAFKYSSQIITYDEYGRLLRDIDFDFAISDKSAKSIHEKFKFLYEIGLLGIEATDEYVNRYTLSNQHAFYFNEGLIPLRGLESDIFENCRIIIHPIFSEYLTLKVEKKELPLDYSWDYLHTIEHHMKELFYA